jgi:IS1 family transposase
MKQVTVYQVDYVRKTRIPIGWVTERRNKARYDNLIGLVRLARSVYATDARDAYRIVVDSREAQVA